MPYRFEGRVVEVVVTAVACCAVVGCMRVVLTPATFPHSLGPWEAPLIGPSTGHLVVPVRLEQDHADGTRRTALHGILDTGLGRTIVPATVAEELGLDTLRTSTRIRDTAGHQEGVRAAVISAIFVGDLSLTNVPVAIASGAGQIVIGHDILSRVAFEADLDRGKVVFGGPPFGVREHPQEVDLHCFGPNRSPLINVELPGGVVRMSLDTGAHVTAIDAATALELGLPREELSEPKQIHYLHSNVTVDHIYRAEQLGLGELRVNDVAMTPAPGLPTRGIDLRRAGLLGMDVLGRFRFRFDPGTCRLSVLPRASPSSAAHQ